MNVYGLAKTAAYPSWGQDDAEMKDLEKNIREKHQRLMNTPSPDSTGRLTKWFRPGKYKEIQNNYNQAQSDFYAANKDAFNHSLKLHDLTADQYNKRIARVNDLRNQYTKLNTDQERAEFRQQQGLEPLFKAKQTSKNLAADANNQFWKQQGL